MLSAVERCVDLIARTRSRRIDLSRISFDDRETFQAIRKAVIALGHLQHGVARGLVDHARRRRPQLVGPRSPPLDFRHHHRPCRKWSRRRGRAH
jgi:hypothetical protein